MGGGERKKKVSCFLPLISKIRSLCSFQHLQTEGSLVTSANVFGFSGELGFPLQEQHHDPPGNLRASEKTWENLASGRAEYLPQGSSGLFMGFAKIQECGGLYSWHQKKCQEALLRDSCEWHCCLGTWPSRVGRLLWVCLSLGTVPASPQGLGTKGLEEVGAAPSALPRSLCISAELIKG